MDRDTFLALASALEDLGRAQSVARGGQRNTGQFYQMLAESGQKAEQRKLDQAKADAEAKRQAVLDTYKANEENRAKAKFEAETSAGEDDPNSKASQIMRNIMQKRFPEQDFSNMTARQIKAIPLRQEAVGGNKRFANLTDEDGVVRSYLVDLDTGEKTPVGRAGFAPNTFEDPVTGERNVFVPSSGTVRPLRMQAQPQVAQPAMPQAAMPQTAMPQAAAPQLSVPSTALLPGETPKQRDERVRLESKQTEGKIKSEQERASEKRKATEKMAELDLMEKDLMKLHKAATFKGPVMGQIGKTARGMGFSVDPAAAQFQNQVQLWANEYIRETSGAGVPVEEFEVRFKPLLPQIGSSSELAEQQFKAFKDYVKRTFQAKYGKGDEEQIKTIGGKKFRKAPGGWQEVE